MNLLKRPALRNGLLATICAITFIGCSKGELGEVDLELQLKEKYHGKYELVSVFSDRNVDLDMDGSSTANLIYENPMMRLSTIEIRFIDKDVRLSCENQLYFVETWPVEGSVLLEGIDGRSTTPLAVSPPYYNLHVSLAKGKFDHDYKRIWLQEVPQDYPNNARIEIESVELEKNEIVKVTSTRRLYTKVGWVTTRVIARYRRYAIIT